MSKGLSPVEAVLAMLSSLTLKERKRIADELAMDPCRIQGHKFKHTQRNVRWFLPPVTYCYCERCGKRITV